MRSFGQQAGRTVAILLSIGLGSCVLLGEAFGQEPPLASFDVIKPADNPSPKALEEGTSPETAKQDTPRGEPDEPTLSFNFRFAPWEDVLKLFAQVAGLTLDLTEVPKGTFNYYDAGRYTPNEALDILNGYLLQRGYVLVRRDKFLVCLNTEKGIPPNLVPLVTVEQLPERGKNELVSVIFSLENADGEQVADGVRELLGPQTKVAVLRATNSLVITDIGSNLRLIDQLLKRGAFQRVTEGSSESTFQAFALRHVRASEVEEVVRKFFGLPSSKTADGAEDGQAVSNSEPSANGLRITTDSRTNRLFVTAPHAQMTVIQQIVEAVDVEEDPSQQTPYPRGGASAVRIVPAGRGDVIIIGRTLESLSPRIKVSTTPSRRSESADVVSPEVEPAGEADDGRSGTPPSPSAPDGRDG